MDIKNVILDIVSHTNGLGIINNIKVAGDDSDTTLAAMDTDKTVIMNATMHQPVPEFVGEFGMGNLGLLNSLTKFSTYKGDDATLELTRREYKGAETPSTLVFKDASGNKDEYRFMGKEMIDRVLQVAKFKGASWDITIEPAQNRIEQLSEVAGVYSGIEPTFSVKTEDGNLIFEVGNSEGGITGRRIFAQNIDGDMSTQWSWPLNTFLNILKLGGTSVVRFSNQGVCQIDVDSGIGVYSYLLPAVTQ